MALPASCTFLRIILSLRSPRTGRADRAGSASNAAALRDHRLRVTHLGFRVVTPSAPQWAPFHVHTRSDAWTIVDRKGNNICNDSTHSSIKGPGQHIGLGARVELNKPRAETADTHKEILMQFRMNHCILHLSPVHHADIQGKNAQIKGCIDQVADRILMPGKKMPAELQVLSRPCRQVHLS